MRAIGIPLSSLFFAATAAAQAIPTVDVTTAAQTAPTGATITFVATVRNTGNASFGFTAHLSTTPGRLISVPAGCDPDGTCPVSLGPGETKTFAFSGEVTNDMAAAGQQFRGSFSGFTVIPDDMPIQFSGSKAVPITLSPAQLDLGVAFAVPSATSSLGQFESALTVTNAGPSAAAPVAVTLSISPDPVRLLAALPLGTWDCVPACDGCAAGIRKSFTCTLPRLGANESSTARLEFEVSRARTYTITAAVSTANATDIAFANNTSTTTVMAGTSSDFTRALVPLLANQTPGAFTTWSSELWAQSTAPGTSIVYCRPDCPADLNQTTRLLTPVVEKLWPVSTTGALPHGAMLYFESDAAPFTSFSSRLYSARNSPARAVEQPVIREAQFRKDRLIIPTVVLDPSHRFLLRVYDPDATPNAVVRVRLFRGSPDFTLAERTLTLTTNPTRIPVLNVPAFPGYGESSDLFTSEIPVSGSREVGVEIVSVTPGLKLWAFVSATENAGEHVTIVSPQ
jgi:hypothetical protein